MKNADAENMVKNVVALLKEERQRQKLSYSKLSLKAGIHYTTISLIERGKQSPTLLICKKLCVALNISLASIIKKSENV